MGAGGPCLGNNNLVLLLAQEINGNKLENCLDHFRKEQTIKDDLACDPSRPRLTDDELRSMSTEQDVSSVRDWARTLIAPMLLRN